MWICCKTLCKTVLFRMRSKQQNRECSTIKTNCILYMRTHETSKSMCDAVSTIKSSLTQIMAQHHQRIAKLPTTMTTTTKTSLNSFTFVIPLRRPIRLCWWNKWKWTGRSFALVFGQLCTFCVMYKHRSFVRALHKASQHTNTSTCIKCSHAPDNMHVVCAIERESITHDKWKISLKPKGNNNIES